MTAPIVTHSGGRKVMHGLMEHAIDGDRRVIGPPYYCQLWQRIREGKRRD